MQKKKSAMQKKEEKNIMSYWNTLTCLYKGKCSNINMGKIRSKIRCISRRTKQNTPNYMYILFLMVLTTFQ